MAADHGRRPLLRAGAHDPPAVSRALGVLLLCGVVLIVLQLSLPDREEAHAAVLYGIGAIALALGGASVLWARHARPWSVHTVFAAGAGLICLGVYATGAATGAYSVLFVWLVVMAASFFSAKATAAHVAWILVASGVTFAVVDASGPPALIRWTFGSLLLVAGAAVMGQIAAGRRSVEEQLRVEIEEKGALQRKLQHLAHHDPLTGVPNRRRFEQELHRELARVDRQGAPLSVVALDLDEFKEYNDVHGHVAGDRLLRHVAGAWTEALRAVDVIARLGGDEFVVLLPDCPQGEAERVAQRLCGRVPHGLTCSAGTACWDGEEPAETLLMRADQAMYAAKGLAKAHTAGERASAVGE